MPFRLSLLQDFKVIDQRPFPRGPPGSNKETRSRITQRGLGTERASPCNTLKSLEIKIHNASCFSNKCRQTQKQDEIIAILLMPIS